MPDQEKRDKLRDELSEKWEPSNRSEPTVDDLLMLFNSGRIGEIEFRNWLAELYPSFARARRTDIDDYLEAEGIRIAEEKAKERAEQGEEEAQKEAKMDELHDEVARIVGDELDSAE